MEPPASESPNCLPFKKRARMVDTSSSEQQQQQRGQGEALSLPKSNNSNGNALNSISRISPETASAIAALTPEHVNPTNDSTSTTSSINNSITRTNSPHEDSLEEILNADLCIAKAFQAADEAWGSVSNKYLQSKVIFTLEDVFQMIKPAIDQMMKQEEEKKKKQEGKKKLKKKSKTQKTEKTSGISNTSSGTGTATKSNKSTAVAATTSTAPKRGKTLPNLSSVRKSPVQQEPSPKTTPSPTTTTQSTSTSKKRKRATSNEYTFAQQAFTQNIPHNLPKSLALPTDSKFINQLHQFVRSDLLEIIQEQDRIGFQCIFCKHNTNPQQMHKFFPTCLENSSGGIYRSVCTWQRVHFKSCKDVPSSLKKKYDALKEADRTRGRVQYWEDSAKQIGLWNKKDGGICFIGDGNGDGC